MGRRGVRVDDAGRWVFNRLAEAYRARPPYPAALVDRIAELGGGAGARIVDVGAGIGHLAIPLAERGAIVVAVEPARMMLSVLRERIPPGLAARIEPVHAAAEATGLPARSFDLLLLADALHWVDPERAGAEAARLLRPGGVVAVVEASFADTPFLTGLSTLISRANPKAQRRPPGARAQLLSIATAGALTRTERFRQEHPLDDAGLDGLLRSMSHVGPALGPARLEALVDEARELARLTGGARLVRDLALGWSRRRAGEAP